MVIIPFDAKFSKQDKDYDPFIKYKLRSEEVMEALIAKAVPALKEVLSEQQFEHCSKVDENMDEFEKSNNPILQFFEELDEGDYLNEPIKAVYQKYNTFCFGSNIRPIGAMDFQKQIKKHYDLVVKTIEIDGKKVRVYSAN